MTRDAEHDIADGAGAERRSAVRSAIRRKAKFSARSGKGFLRDGAVVDISREGLQLQTYDAPSPGTFVELEIQPRAADLRAQVTMVRGRVVRTTPLDNGLVAAGVRFHMAPLDPPAPLAHVVPESDKQMGSAFASDTPVAAPPIAPVSRLAFPPNRFTHARRHWRKAVGVALALLLALLLWNVEAPFDKQANADATHSLQTPNRGAPEYPVTFGTSTPSNTPGQRAQRHAPRLSSERLGALRVPASSAPVHPGPVSSSLPGLTRLEPLKTTSVSTYPPPSWAPAIDAAALNADAFDDAGATAPAQLLARVDRAQLALSLGKKDEARRLLDGAAALAPDAPEVWRKYAVTLASDLSNPAGESVDLPLFSDAVLLKPDDASAAPDEGLWIDVDKADFVLTIMNHSRPLRRFPVGLGGGNTTPSGNYRVANKLTNPDWYNRGESVPAGDPRNPLGKHWMGLGNERGVPTSYGIHSISSPSDLGQPVGRGCIRMIPSDAEALFRLCPIGTPVRIHP